MAFFIKFVVPSEKRCEREGEKEREKFICHISHNQYKNNFTQQQAARKENSITAGHL